MFFLDNIVLLNLFLSVISLQYSTGVRSLRYSALFWSPVVIAAIYSGWDRNRHKAIHWGALSPLQKLKRTCVGGIVASIAAFQAVDPGSIPGQRSKTSRHAIVFEISSLCQQCS